MKKYIRLTMMLAAMVVAVQAVWAAEPANYYNSANGKNDEALMTALRNIIRNHTTLSYSKVWDAFKTTDTDAQGYIIDMYSTYRYRPSDHGSSANYIGSGYNREHSFPKSWFDDDSPMYTDIHHLYPTDVCINSQRGNYPFGVCEGGRRIVTGSYSAKGRLGSSTYPGYSGTVFEPDDEYKGDFARTYFYMVTCYKNELPSWSGSPQLNYSVNRYKAFSTWSINMLMEWTRLDPVSEKEIKRNDAVFALQGNRNPFIDHPELAEYIWGNMQGQAWNGSGEVIPPSIISPEDGSTIDMGSTVEGTELSYHFTLKGRSLTKGLTLSMTDNEFYYVSRNSFSANEANNGVNFTVTFTADEVGTYRNVITIASDEVSASFTVTATATEQGEIPDPPAPVIVGDSIMEDWEGCTTGGYWSKLVVGHQWSWNFVDAGIWGDNLSRGKQSCRLGKTSSSSIAMAEDVDGGTSAIAFWAGCYGSDGDAMLRVDYSNDKGLIWNTLGSVTAKSGSLQQFRLAADVKGAVRFRIVQTTGMRVNIDDITLFSRVESIPGDVNGDGEVNIADINTVIDAILGDTADPACDVNGDHEVNIADINAIIDLILGA